MPDNHVQNIKADRRTLLRSGRGGWAPLSSLVVGWAVVVSAGSWAMWRHALTPGPVARASQDWPGDGKLSLSEKLPTLVMCVHPDCPCSRASVDELEILMARCDGKLAAYVLFAEPTATDSKIETVSLWKSVQQIPGVHAIADPDAALIRRFGGQISGQVFLYDTRGALQFSGGLTGARGHEGDNEGLTAAEAIVHSAKPAVRSTPVYGCKIW